MPSEHGVNPYEKLFPASRVQPCIRLQQKLHRIVPQLSQSMAAVTGFIVDYPFVQPQITELTVTTDGAVIARLEGEPTYAHFVTDYDDLTRNWFGLLVAARLSVNERMYADELFAERIGFYGVTEG